MVNIRELAESELEYTLEGDFGLPVELIDPEGVLYDGLSGQVIYDTIVEDSDGSSVVIHKPVVSLRRSSLTRVPFDGEKWSVKIPITPSTTATKKTYLLDRPSEDGGSIGFIRLYLIEAQQS